MRYEFDALGNRLKEYIYDANQYLVEVKEPDDAGAGYHTAQTFSYDAAGRMETSADALGRTLTYTYDARDRVIQIAYHDSSTERFAYGNSGDGTGNLLVAQQDRNGAVTSYEYDDAGRKVKTIHRMVKKLARCLKLWGTSVLNALA